MGKQDDILNNLQQELRKGTLVLAVLSQLFKPHYGYSLVETLNDKGLRIDQNTLYPLLRRLDKKGLLEASWDTKEARPRKYYKLSSLGKDVFDQLKKEFHTQNKMIQLLLEEDQQ